VQVEPTKPVLKAPGSKRLKLKCDERFLTLLSNSACAATPWLTCAFSLPMASGGGVTHSKATFVSSFKVGLSKQRSPRHPLHVRQVDSARHVIHCVLDRWTALATSYTAC